MQIGQAKVWTLMVQDVSVCSEVSQFQFNHKAGFVLKAVTERERRKERRKDGWKRMRHLCVGLIIIVTQSQ